MKLILLFVVICLIWDTTDGRKMWGSRKKREQDELDHKPPAAEDLASVHARKSQAARVKPSGRRSIPGSSSPPLDSVKFEEMFNLYLTSFEQLLESDDFDSMVNPESIRSMMIQFPGAADIPELNALLSMPEFSDPALLKATMRDGLQLAKSSGAEIFSILNDPEKMGELLGQLPPEVQKLIEGLKSGDFSALKDFVVSLPGLDATQRRLLISLLDGNTDALSAELEKVLGDEAQVEAARLQFLAAPELAEAMGLPLDLLEDPVRWAETMAQGADALLGGSGKGKTGRGGATDTARQSALMQQLLKSFAKGSAEVDPEGEVEEENAVPFAKRRFAGRAA